MLRKKCTSYLFRKEKSYAYNRSDIEKENNNNNKKRYSKPLDIQNYCKEVICEPKKYETV